jgi:hypothetical protein
MFYLYDKGKAQSITDAGTEIHLRMEKMFRAYGRKTKIERLYGKRHTNSGPHISFEEHRPGERRENTGAIKERR